MQGDIGRRHHSIIMAPAFQGKHDSVRLAVYRQVWKYLSNDYAIIYAAEPDPSRVIQQMSKVAAELAPDEEREIENCITRRALTVINRNEFYQPSKTNELDIPKLTGLWRSLVLEVHKQSKPRGIVAIGDPSTFFENDDSSHRHIKLAQYESAICKELVKPLEEAICWYNNPGLVAKMSFSDLVNLINTHHSTIHTGWLYREWRPHDIIAHVREGMDRVLGKGTANLIFKTLQLVYKVDPEQTIIFQPDVFEEKLRKIMGDSIAKLLFDVLADALRKEVSFNRISQLH